MLLDTSGLLCLHHRAEPFHAQARAAYHGARVRLTHGYILAEFVALALLLARPGKTYSLCDAVSFVLRRRRNLSEALTTDRHFEQEGFRRLLM